MNFSDVTPSFVSVGSDGADSDSNGDFIFINTASGILILIKLIIDCHTFR